jgi:hypothetical protein
MWRSQTGKCDLNPPFLITGYPAAIHYINKRYKSYTDVLPLKNTNNITKMYDNINMDSTKLGSINAHICIAVGDSIIKRARIEIPSTCLTPPHVVPV